jgi:DNA-binding SARP family transcriptional activator
MIFHVLGPLEAHSSTGAVVDLGTRKAGTVLGVLLLHPNAWVRTEELVSATWQEQAVPAAAKANLKTYVSQLRRALPPFGDGNRIEARPGAYRLRVGRGELDSDRAAELAETARAAISAGDHSTASGLLEDALALWRGRPFEGLALDEACTAAGRLDELRHDIEESLAEVQLASGRRSEAIATLRELTRQDPLREGAWALLVRTLNAAGRRGEAVAAYDGARAVLAAELGVQPGPELAGAFSAARPRRELPRDVPFLVGRSQELALVRRFPRGALVVIDGMSGVGKTAFAVHAAHRLAGDFPDGQLFVNLRAGAVSVGDALARLVRGLGISGVPTDVDELAALWRSEVAGRRVLLVLDDAGDAGQVLPLLPGDGEAAVLITTRQRGWRLPGETRISLEPLCFRESVTLLRQASGRLVGDPAAVVRACGGLPSALLTAAARFRSRPLWTLDELASWCSAPGRLLDGLTCSLPGAAAQRAFRSIGALPPEFDCAAAAHHLGIGRQDAHALLEELVDHHLLDTPAAGRYRSHPLVRELARRAVPAVVRAA